LICAVLFVALCALYLSHSFWYRERLFYSSNTLCDTLSSSSSNNTRRAILVTTDVPRLKLFAKNLPGILSNLNCFRYPIIVFLSGSIPEAKQLIQDSLSESIANLFEFFPFNEELPNGLDKDFLRKVGVPHMNRFPGYHLMCSFWAHEVFHHPRVKDLQYYMRLDTDSIITSKIPFDIFDLFQRNDWKYGYVFFRTDDKYLTWGMWEFMKIYQTAHEITSNVIYPSPEEYGDVAVPIYYNNFEIVHVPTFREPQVLKFLKAVGDSNYIFWRRWGDAPIRYFTVQFLLKPSEVHHVCYMDYMHHVSFGATCPLPPGTPNSSRTLCN